MTTITKFQNSEFPTIICNRLVVRPTTTTLKWNPDKKNINVTLTGAIDTARCNITTVSAGILASLQLTMGATATVWYYIINITSIMHFGLALATQNLSTTLGPSFKVQISVTEGDLIRCILTTTTVTLQRERLDGSIVVIQTWPVSTHIGQVLYPWISSNLGSTMSAKIMLDNTNFNITTDPDGKSRMTGTNNDIVDFNVENIVTNDPGSGGGVSGPSDRIVNTGAGVSVIIDNSGSVNHLGGLTQNITNLTVGGPIVILAANQHIVNVSTPTITSVRLPAASAYVGRRYVIMRNYAFQTGETIANPALHITVTGGDTISGGSTIGMPPNATIQLISDGVSKWLII